MRLTRGGRTSYISNQLARPRGRRWVQPLLAGVSGTKISWQILNEERLSSRVDLHATADEFDNVGIGEL